jgi:uncharacterized protein YndB with AHSA1/START domain
MSESTTMSATTSRTVQVYRVFIKAAAESIWQAITDPEWNNRYGYRCAGEYDLRPGGAYRVAANEEMKKYGSVDVILTGEVVSADPPHRLVQTWHAHFGPEMEAEGPNKVTWEIEEMPGGVCSLTLTHELGNAPVTAAQISGENREAGGGWALILSDMKTLLETGKAFQE